jgi:hypothetical protein
MSGQATIGWRRALVFVSVTVLTLGLCAEGCRRMLDPNHHPLRTVIDEVDFADEDFAEQCGPESSILITVVHSPEKEAWLLEGAQRFMQRCSNTQVSLQALTDLQALDAIEHEGLQATMWSPSDELFVDGTTRELHLDPGLGLIRTPLVLLTWQTRYDALTTHWSQTSRGWPQFEDDPQMFARLVCGGTELDDPQLDFVHNVPTQTSAGGIALLLLVSGYLRDFDLDDAASELEFDQLLDAHEPELFDWLRRCQEPRPDFEETPRVLTQRFMALGRTGFDGVATYEQLAIEAFENFDPGQQGTPDLRLVYPAQPFVSNHPVAYFPVTSAAMAPPLAAARRFTAFLREDEMQALAVEMGHRPGDPSVDISAMRVGANPFLEHRHRGIELELDPEFVRPSFDFLHDCMLLWSDATKRD